MSDKFKTEYLITLIEETKKTLRSKAHDEKDQLAKGDGTKLCMEFSFGPEESDGKENKDIDFQLLIDLAKVLDERKNAYDAHGQKLRQIIDLRNKVRQQWEKVQKQRLVEMAKPQMCGNRKNEYSKK